MGLMTRRIFVILVGGTLGVWSSYTDRDAVVAQQCTLDGENPTWQETSPIG